MILPIGGVHQGVVHALHYAKSISPDVTAIYVDVDPSQTERVIEKWDRWGEGRAWKCCHHPIARWADRSKYLDLLDREHQTHDMITVVLPQFAPSNWWGNPLHNQTALMLRLSLIFRRGTVVTGVPYRFKG